MTDDSSLPLGPVAAGPLGLTHWGRARRLLSLDRSELWLCLVYGIAIGLLSLVMPIAVQTLVNTVAFASILQPLGVVTVLVALGLAFSGLMRVLQAYVVEVLQERMLVRGVLDLTERVLRTKPTELAARHTPALSHRFFEVPVLQKTASMVFVEGIELLLKLAVGLPLLAMYHPLLLLFSLVLLVLIAVVIFVLGRGAVVTAIAESTAKYDAAGWLEHLLRVPNAFRGHAARREARLRAEVIASRYRDARRDHFRRILRHQLGGIFIKVVGAAVLLGVGGMLVIDGQMTLGQLVAAELVFASIAVAMLKLHKQLENVYDLTTSAHKLGALLDLPLERTGGEHPTAVGPAAVTLQDAAVGYPNHVVLEQLELAIRPGERVLIAGASGAGKTALLDAIATTGHLERGTFEFDGSDLRLLDLDEVRAQISHVREPELVVSSLLANLRLGRAEVSLGEIEDALQVVGLRDVITALPGGHETEVLPSGRPLSRTQSRRFALACALVARPRLLLLDGALDDLGLEGEARGRLLDHVLGAGAPWTCVVTGSDPEVRRRCDRVLALRDGRLEVSDA